MGGSISANVAAEESMDRQEESNLNVLQLGGGGKSPLHTSRT